MKIAFSGLMIDGKQLPRWWNILRTILADVGVNGLLQARVKNGYIKLSSVV